MHEAEVCEQQAEGEGDIGEGLNAGAAEEGFGHSPAQFRQYDKDQALDQGLPADAGDQHSPVGYPQVVEADNQQAEDDGDKARQVGQRRIVVQIAHQPTVMLRLLRLSVALHGHGSDSTLLEVLCTLSGVACLDMLGGMCQWRVV